MTHELFENFDTLDEAMDHIVKQNEVIAPMHAELTIRTDWIKELSALNLKWAKVFSLWKHGGAA